MILPWFKAFVLTLAIECPIAASILRVKALRRTRLLLLLVFANLATHPMVWFVFPALPIAARAAFVLSELFAIGAEGLFFALVFQGTTVRRALAASLVANATSLGVGLLLYRFAGDWLLS
jgi:hypothetical protein